MAPEVVILDVDGTLLDSNDAHAHAWIDALSERGIDLDFADVRRCIGMGGDKLLPALTAIRNEDPRAEAIHRRRNHIFKDKYVKKLKPFPGVRELLKALKERGYRLVVATSATEDEADALLLQTGIADLVEHETTSSDAEKSKPDPDIVKAALRHAGVAPEKAIMLGDTPYDVVAAEEAGVPCVALRCGGWDLPNLDGAVAVYDDPADLLHNLDRSPFAKRT